MNENNLNSFQPSDGEILDGVRRRLTGVEPLVPVPPTWQPEGAARVGGERMGAARIHVRAAGAFGFGGVIAVALVAGIIAMSWASQGPRNTSGASSSQVPTPTESQLPIVAPKVITPSDLPTNGRTIGNPNAPVTLNVWVDYRCTVCLDFATVTMPKLLQNYVRSGELKINYHDLLVIDSVTSGTESRDAANASRCAADQGKFWAYQDWLFANQSPSESNGAFTLDRLTEMANRAGLDMTKFKTCLTSGQHNAEVLAESNASTAVGVPAFQVNGIDVTGIYADLAAAIDAALAKTASPSTLPAAATAPPATPSTRPAIATAPPAGLTVPPTAASPLGSAQPSRATP